MTKDEELKEAREWWGNSTDDFPECDHDLAKLLAAFYRHMLDKAWVSVKEIKLSNLIGKFIILWDNIHGFRTMKVYSIFDKPPSDATHYFVPEPPKEMK